ncbi:hypothetical protein TSUD_141430 [Trifolium subterraneum]|uniref:Uncharacterized protein n=1 Tax=Trifolium subterraneum TaxID=3900 RepID=A0A2Z6NV97_TRISU|nr:hypothetical protein TSUD_141430 [Trifolium subterraneum]
MGNNLCGEEHCSNHVTLGSHACIDMIKEEDGSDNDDDGGYSQAWTASYKVFESSCTLYLKKYVDDCDSVNEVFLKVEDDMCSGGGMRVWGGKRGLIVVEGKRKSREDKHLYTMTVAHYYAGPDRHPSSALFYMFEQVYKSGSWKLASCPHCVGEPQGRQSIEVKHNDEDILQTNLDSFPIYKQLHKSTSFEQDRTTNMTQPQHNNINPKVF